MLELFYDTEEEIPEGFRQLYIERNGRFEFNGVKGIKTQADVDRLSTALAKERKDHKEARDKLNVLGDIDPVAAAEALEQVTSLNEQIEALKAGGAFDETKAEPIIKARVNQAIGPLERQKNQLERQLADVNNKLNATEQEKTQLASTITMDRVERAVRDAAIEAKVMTSAIYDVIGRARTIFEYDEGKILTKDGGEAVPGLTPKEWLKDMVEKAPHWWPTSNGGGAGGGSGPGFEGKTNPWSKAGWNLTAQGAYTRAHGEAKAKEMAARAGSYLGATKPTAA
jgi:hypothetical protein